MSGMQCFNMGHSCHGINLYGVVMILMGNLHEGRQSNLGHTRFVAMFPVPHMTSTVIHLQLFKVHFPFSMMTRLIGVGRGGLLVCVLYSNTPQWGQLLAIGVTQSHFSVCYLVIISHFITCVILLVLYVYICIYDILEFNQLETSQGGKLKTIVSNSTKKVSVIGH